MRRLDAPITVAVAMLAIAATAAALIAGAAGALVADGARIRDGELWRLVTGPLVHATWAHLVRDLAIVVLVGVAYEAPLRRVWPVLVAAGLIAPAAAVVGAGWDGYVGTSGLGHALIAAALVHEVRARRRVSWYVACASAALVAKVGYELVAGSPLFAMELGPGVTQVPIAHAIGVAIGAGVCQFGLTRGNGRVTRRTQESFTIAT